MPSLHHNHKHRPKQCTSTMVQYINAPLPLVWSVLRRFDQPHVYKNFVRKCTMLAGSGGVGSIREVTLVSGLPGKVSRERLDRLDDDMHVMVYTMIDGDQRLENFQSTTTAHETVGGHGTVVVESYVVDVPEGNSEEDTRVYVNTVLGCNLRSLATVTEELASDHTYPG
ncbi:Abscisic acid receptor pyl12 [Orobanche minor]